MTSPRYQAWLEANTSAGKPSTPTGSKVVRMAKPSDVAKGGTTAAAKSKPASASNSLARFTHFAKAPDTPTVQATPEAKLSPLRRLPTRAEMAAKLADAAGFDTAAAAAAFAIKAAMQGRGR